ncbi:MAG: hypothetical protein IT356_02710 [Gemmatimonadaceae bacterium]|nr:hypothetical protein [Gemmatimonadaceae bacterium]
MNSGSNGAGQIAIRSERVALWATAAVILVLGFLPISSLLPEGMRDGGYTQRWREWALGLLICAGAGTVSALLFRQHRTGKPLEAARRAASRLDRKPLRTDVALAATCCIVYLVIARFVFSGRPLLIDEIVQVLQARLYATGRLTVPAPAAPEFFSVLHVVDVGPKVYSQFPPGWPAMLSIGSLIGQEWIVGPLCGAVAVATFARLLRRIYGQAASLTVIAGTLLFGLGPFVAFQFGSHMSHGPVLMWILLATLALAVAAESRDFRSTIVPGVLAGLFAGCAFAVRPLDAVAYAAPAAAAVVLVAPRQRNTYWTLALAGAGLALPIALVCWVNVVTTGSATAFGYEVLWGSAHSLGFHAAPWGEAHTPQRGLELISLYLTRLNTYLFETPFPSLLPVAAGLLVIRRLDRIEQFLFAGTIAHAVLYFAYWHDGFYLGPRFVTPWAAFLVLVCIRAARLLAARQLPPVVRAAAPGVLVATIGLTLGSDIPGRIAQYRSGLSSMRTDYAGAAKAAGATHALVFVHESWGAQLVARLWALGVSRPATATLYARVDACALDHRITELEERRVTGDAAEQALRPLLADSLRIRSSNVSPDTTERMLPGSVYDAECSAQVVADRDGYALYPPFLLDNRTGNLYARDFGPRDSVLVRMHPDRPVFRVTRDGVDGTAPLMWTRIERH